MEVKMETEQTVEVEEASILDKKAI